MLLCLIWVLLVFVNSVVYLPFNVACVYSFYCGLAFCVACYLLLFVTLVCWVWLLGLGLVCLGFG